MMRISRKSTGVPWGLVWVGVLAILAGHWYGAGAVVLVLLAPVRFSFYD